MTRIELTRKTIDPLTGSDVIEKKVFKLNANADPTMSVVFHKTADLLGVKTFDRANPHVYRKLAVLYNWAAEKARSNDPDRVFNKLNDYRSKLGLNVIGQELVDSLYRNIRFELDRNAEAVEAEFRQQGIDEINKDLKHDAKRASRVRRDREQEDESIKVQERVANRHANKAVRVWEDSLIKDRNIKIKVIDDTHLEEHKETL